MSGIEALLTGRVIGGRYRIEEVIGRGGMGAVYRATDERLGRPVAVKVITISGGLDTDAREKLRARFRQEANAVARLPHHPNVVPVYDYGTDETLGLDYLVMELLRGQDLASLLARTGPPPIPTALTILLGAARGVAVGHRARLIHRDVKPGNVFLAPSEDGDATMVRVLDFGIAKVMTDDDSGTQLTHDGRAPLSPAYASPEQLRGEDRLTPASDVFSLGALGYQLLVGERPFTDADRNRMAVGGGGPPPPTPPPAPRSAVPVSPAPVTLKNCRRVSPLEGPRPLKRPPLPSATAILLFGPCRKTND
jgi:eukaryotic-like serine/threonine-protein kinase